MNATPWVTEASALDFEHNGMPCAMRRHFEMGHWCGYVGVPPTHPLHGMNCYDAEGVMVLDVHGGITYADGAVDNTSPRWDGCWWFGFDCAHLGDLVPGMPPVAGLSRNDIYRDQAYVMAQCKTLAEQLAAITHNPEK